MEVEVEEVKRLVDIWADENIFQMLNALFCKKSKRAFIKAI